MAGMSQARREAPIKAAGLWDEFQARKKALKEEYGGDGKRAYHDAIEEFQAKAATLTASGSMPMVPASTFAGRRCSTRRAVEWVAQNVGVSDPDPDECPSAQAWGMLRWIRSSPVNESEFWRQIYPKLIPTKAQLEAEDAEANADDGQLEALIAEVEKAADDAESVETSSA